MAENKELELIERFGKQALVLSSSLDLILRRTNDLAGKYAGFNNIEAYGEKRGKLFKYASNCTKKAIGAFDRLFEYAVSKYDPNKATEIECGDDLTEEAYDAIRLLLLWQNATTNQPKKRIKEIEDYLNSMCNPKDRRFSKKFIDSLKLSA